MIWRTGRIGVAALLGIGVVAGMAVSSSPVRAHITTRFSHLWTTHIRPAADLRYYTKAAADARFIQPGATLPTGVTLKGTFKLGGTNPAGGGTSHASGAISFGGYSFASPPAYHFLALSDPRTAECAGDFNFPTAAPGHVCFYEEAWGNSTVALADPPKPFGVELYNYSGTAAGHFWIRGSWAATSP